MTPQQTLDAIFAAWNTWRVASNASKTDANVEANFNTFVQTIEPLAVANGHPPGVPKRKL
jgi:hypothetical protein